MRYLLHSLVRLYPLDWRKRYGAEFEALIEDARPGLGGAFDILKGALIMQATRNFVIAAAALVVVLGVLSAMDVRNRTYTGYSKTANDMVKWVEPGSPAAAAGLQWGDVLKSVNGVAATDWKGLDDMHRPAVGATWPYVMERNGQTLNLQISQAPLPANEVYWARAFTLLSLGGLGLTVWAYFSAPGAPTAALAVLGLAFGAYFGGLPYFESPAVRGIVGNFSNLGCFVLACAAEAHFLLVFPSRRFLNRRWGTKILYAPVVILVLIAIWIAIFPTQPSSRGLLFLYDVYTPFMVVYWLLIVVLMVWRYAAATAADRAAHGLGLLLAAVVVQFGPVLLYPIVNLVSPHYATELMSDRSLRITLIPILFSIAAVRSARGKALVGAVAAAPA